MATAKTLDPIELAYAWQARSIQLAKLHELTAKLLCRDVRGCDVYSVPSKSHPLRPNIVKFHVARRQLECTCVAASYGNACGHAGAALVAIEAARLAAEKAAERQQDEAWRYWLNGGEW